MRRRRRENERERKKRVVAHLHSRSVRGYLVAHPSSSLTEEKRMMIFVSM